MPRLFTNNAATTLASDISNSATSLTVASGKGALFPNPTSPDYFLVTLDDGTNIEVVKVTARSTDTFTIVRGFDNTTGTAFAAATPTNVELRIPANVLNDAHNCDANNNEWTGQSSNPSAPSSGNAHVLLKLVSGRPLLKTFPADGWDTPYQPALFQNGFFMIQPNTSTTIGVLGGAVTSVGTVSHPTADTTIGDSINQVTGTTAGNTAGTGHVRLPYFRGNSAIQPGGWFMASRLYFPDASYGSGATGFRAFIGMINGTMASSVGADDPGGHHSGFTFSTNASDTYWSFSTRDGTTRNKNTSNATVAFTAQHIYDFYQYVACNTSTIYWRVDDITAGTTAEGSNTSNLPGATTLLRGGHQIATLTTTGRNIRCKKVYIETNI